MPENRSYTTTERRNLLANAVFLSDLMQDALDHGDEWNDEVEAYIRENFVKPVPKEMLEPSLEPFRKGGHSPLAQLLAERAYREQLANRQIVLDDIGPRYDFFGDKKPMWYDERYADNAALKQEGLGLEKPPQDIFVDALAKSMLQLEMEPDDIEQQGFLSDVARTGGTAMGMGTVAGAGKRVIGGLLGRLPFMPGRLAQAASGPLAFGAYETAYTPGTMKERLGAGLGGLTIGAAMEAAPVLGITGAGILGGEKAAQRTAKFLAGRPGGYLQSAGMGMGLAALGGARSLSDLAAAGLGMMAAHGIPDVMSARRLKGQTQKIESVIEQETKRLEGLPAIERAIAELKGVEKQLEDVTLGTIAGALGGGNTGHVGAIAEASLRAGDVPVKAFANAWNYATGRAKKALGKHIENTWAANAILDAREKVWGWVPDVLKGTFFRRSAATDAPEQMRSLYHTMVGSNKLAGHVTYEDIYRPLKAAQYEIIKGAKKKFKRKYSDAQMEAILYSVHQHSGEGGIATGAIYAENPRFAKKRPEWVWLWKETKRVLSNPEKYKDIITMSEEYARWSETIKQQAYQADFWEADVPIEEIGVFEPGIRYVPAYDLEVPKGRAGKRYTKGKPAGGLSVFHPSQQRAQYRGGLFQRLLEGQTPKNFDLASLFAKQHQEVMKVINAKKFRDGIARTSLVDPESGVEVPTALWSHSNMWKTEVDQSKYVAMPDVPGLRGPHGTKLMIHEEAAPLIQAFVEPGYTGGIGTLVRTNYKMKLAKLNYSPFHYWALWQNSLAMGSSPAVSAKHAKMLMDHPIVRDLLKNTEFTLSAPDVSKYATGFEEVLGTGREVGGLFGQKGRAKYNPVSWLMKAHNFNTKHLWDNTYRINKAGAAVSCYNQLRRMGVGHQEALKNTAKTLNNLEGGIDWEWHGISRKSRQLASLVMLAPDWQISNWAFFKQAIADKEPSGSIARMGYARMLVMTFIAGNVLNKQMSGHWMWENEPGKRHLVEFKIPEWWPAGGGQTMYLDFWRQWGEQLRMMLGMINSILPEEDKLAEGTPPLDYVIRKASAFGRFAGEVYTGQQTGSPYGLPTAADIVAGRSHGAWGAKNLRLDSWAISALKTMWPISLEAFLTTYPEEGIEIFSNPRLWAGATGWHFTTDWQERQKRIKGEKKRRISSGR